MKKVLAVLLCICLAAALLCACTAKQQEQNENPEENQQETEEVEETEENHVGMPNPITVYESLDEINAVTGGRLCHPAVMGVTEERYSVIQCGKFDIAQYDFTVAGVKYTFRFSPEKTEDISGIYVEDGALFENDTADSRTAKAFDGGLATRFHTGDGQYVFIGMSDEKMDEATFNLVSDEMFALVSTDGGYADPAESKFVGNWHEKLVGRATMEVTLNEDGYLCFDVRWPDSANSYYVFTFAGKADTDGVVKYDGGFKGVYEIDEDGNEKETILSEEETGRVIIADDGTMLWTENDSIGANEFEKD